ncbi:MAG: N-6 DNA methylase [Sulfuricellaceae bacterium]|nr:N-6 DNA methylase [Sulfuricellaceae bacterium]
MLFIDARNLGHLINRRTRELSHEDIQKIADTYHAWLELPSPAGGRGAGGESKPYEDVKGFCASVPLQRVKELD